MQCHKNLVQIQKMEKEKVEEKNKNEKKN